jgi:1,4-dihydroxy-2-naphthoate octaprenyltransferase
MSPALRPWLLAARVRTLGASAAPVLVGTALAAREGGFRPALAAVTLAAALLIQIGTNFVNDWGDFWRGADGPDRLGPPRAVQSGLVVPRRMVAATVAVFGAAALLGIVLARAGGWTIAAIGVAAILAGIAYTAGPTPLAYLGLGEPFVFVFFGPLAVAGTELVQARRVSAVAVAAGAALGLLATALLLVNNVRDIDSDRRAGKRTLAVRLGRRSGQALYVAAVLTAFAIPVLVVVGDVAPAFVLLTWCAAPLALSPTRTVLTRRDGPALNTALVGTARLHLVFGTILAGALLLG